MVHAAWCVARRRGGGGGQSVFEAMRVHVRLPRLLAPRHNKVGSAMDSTPAQLPQLRGTVRPRASFNAEQSAQTLQGMLHKYRGGADVDVQGLVELLSTHSNQQRQAMRRHYRLLAGTELEADISQHLGGHVKELLLMLLQPPLEFLTDQLHNTIKKVSPRESTLIELLCGRSNSRIQQVKENYKIKYLKDLDLVVKRELNGDLQRLMKLLLTSERDEGNEIILIQAQKDAERLVSAGVGIQYGTDEPVVMSMLYQRSFTHLREMFDAFQRLSGVSIEDSIRTEFRGGLRTSLVTFVQAVKDPVKFYAQQLHEAVQGPMPSDEKIMRLIVARSELDLADVKDSYLEQYGVKLGSVITEITSGEYRRCLNRLLGHFDE